jgi:2-polyprenyl-3-methyl-5-hydroxy-6-metoxy-1,4-benzoquinol methylase
MSQSSVAYVGSELEVFAHAHHWRAYWKSQISPFIGRNVLEVGAGIGSVTRLLCNPDMNRWVAMEPDPSMYQRLRQMAERGELEKNCAVRAGTIADLDPSESFDSILYIDVLEHIKDDRIELEHALRHLEPNGHLIVLAPAHQSLFTPFDSAIGHFRRYSLPSLATLSPPGARMILSRYLDCVGLFASLGNRLFLHSSSPTLKQIKFWDSLLVRISVKVDPFLNYKLGKSVIVIWQKMSGKRS